MSTLETKSREASVANVKFVAGDLVVTLSDGRRIATPISWYPKLSAASDAERNRYEILPSGIHWPALDEDLSVSGMLRGQRASGAKSPSLIESDVYPTRLPAELTDLLLPFSDRKALRPYQVRLQREDVLIDITQRALARFRAEGKPVTPVPNKFLVPFLEKASLEDVTSELKEAWANLLVAASRKFDPKFTIYVDVLSKISYQEAKFLSAVYESARPHGLSWPVGHAEENAETIKAHLNLLEVEDGGLNLESSNARWSAFKKVANLHFGYLLHATVMERNGPAYYHYNSDFLDHGNWGVMCDILEREKLIKRHLIEFRATLGTGAGSVSYIDLTHLAVDLITTCRPVEHIIDQ